MTTKIDLHSHTRGSDGQGTPAQIALAAKKAGLDALCLTDHHTNMTDEVQKVAQALRDVGVLPIIGVEYSTAQGHLLIYGIDVPLKAWGMYPDMQMVVDEVNALGGCCVVPHPYKGYQRALHDKVKSITGLCAVESLNGQVETSNPETNRKAREAAKEMGVPRTGASDAHFPDDIGLTYTEFEATITSEEEFLDALRSGKFVAKRNEDIFKARSDFKKARQATQLASYRWPPPPPPARQLALPRAQECLSLKCCSNDYCPGCPLPPGHEGPCRCSFGDGKKRKAKKPKKGDKHDPLLEELLFREENGLPVDPRDRELIESIGGYDLDGFAFPATMNDEED